MSRIFYALVLTAMASLPAGGASFSFIALGDMPYGKRSESYPPYEALIGEINRRAPRFVIHVGDTKSGSKKCSDKRLREQLRFLMRFQPPTIYTPGDNEWTDCHREKAGAFDPIERLDFIRREYFADPARSFGQAPMALEHQGGAGYPENARAMVEDVMVIAAHVVGSNNNLESRDAKAAAEFFARDPASVAWLRQGFAAAEAADAAAVVVAIHADMFEFAYSERHEDWYRHSGHRNFGTALIEAAERFGGPVLLVFGDSHRFRVFRPFPERAGNVMAVEVFGAEHMHAVEVLVETGLSAPFAVRPVLNPKTSNRQ